MPYKEFQIIIGSIIIGLCIVLGSYIYSQNSDFNACLKAAMTNWDNHYAKNNPDYKREPAGVANLTDIHTCTRR
tara:strand:+ start:600 stop:821 length:222 start_codon:yes stop_codon:yes gene_type:complete